MTSDVGGPNVHFSSPFISVSFKALIEKPSQRGLMMCNDLSHLEWNRNCCQRKREGVLEKPVVTESPPRKRPIIQRVFESPVSKHSTSSFLDQFRMNYITPYSFLLNIVYYDNHLGYSSTSEKELYRYTPTNTAKIN